MNTAFVLSVYLSVCTLPLFTKPFRVKFSLEYKRQFLFKDKLNQTVY